MVGLDPIVGVPLGAMPGCRQQLLQRDVVDLDAALGEPLFDVAVRQPEGQIPADGQDDHVGREAKPAKADCGTEAGRG